MVTPTCAHVCVCTSREIEPWKARGGTLARGSRPNFCILAAFCCQQGNNHCYGATVVYQPCTWRGEAR